MNFLDTNKSSGIDVGVGRLLVATPFLNSPEFSRTVILVCEYQEEGAFGFVINRPTINIIGDLLENLSSSSLPVYAGGPVQTDSLFFLHSNYELLGGKEILQGVFWGTDFERLMQVLRAGTILSSEVKLLLGYAGWSPGQLDAELQEKSWFVAKGNSRLIFQENNREIWAQAIASLGQDFEHFVHFPESPHLN